MSSPFHVKQTETQQHAKTHHISPSQSPEETHLNTAIEQASRTQLCHIVRQLCAHSKTATQMTKDYLIPIPEKVAAPKQVVPRSILKKPGSSKRKSQSQRSPPPVKSTSLLNETPPSSQMQSQGNAKRKATTQCRNCSSEYTSASSDALACVHHPGKREVNSEHEVWNDFDPDVLGDAWTLMEYEEFASGFQWSCCEKDIGARGCMVGRHEVAPVGEWKRARRC